VEEHALSDANVCEQPITPSVLASRGKREEGNLDASARPELEQPAICTSLQPEPLAVGGEVGDQRGEHALTLLQRQAPRRAGPSASNGVALYVSIRPRPAKVQPAEGRGRKMTPRRTVQPRLTRFVVIAACCSIVLVAGVAAAATVEPVLDRKGVAEVDPAASQGYLAWGQFDRHAYNTFVKPDGSPKIRMNPAGTRSFAVGIDGTTAVFDMYRRHDVDLKMFDVLTQTRSAPVAGVNTDANEYEPALSGDWLFFTRDTAPTKPPRLARTRAVLFNTTTSEQRVLANLRLRTHYLFTNQVNGDWATFETCDLRHGEFSDCQVWLYRISTDTLTQVPNPNRQQYSSAVTSDGTLYFVRSGNGDHWVCGKNVQFIRLPDGGSEVVIATLPLGRDVFSSFALEEGDSSTTLLFERDRCSNPFQAGIYEIANADTAT
jgi:hypothetical protein